MSVAEFLKGPCQHCGNSIEFPTDGLGQTTTCPHCGHATMLQIAVATDEAPLAPRRKSPVALFSAVAVALLAAGGFVVSTRMQNHDGGDTPKNPVVQPDIADAPASITNRVAGSGQAAESPAPKSLADLKAGAITFEKTRGSSLVYAVGVLRNESDHQRFGVNIELELTDARGNKVGIAKDYRAVLEPRQEWRFRALVLDSKATAATVSVIREE